MAIDVGERRIGVALSDPLRLLPSPLTTIAVQSRAAAFAQIAALISKNEVVDLVVGMPLTLSGEIGPQAKVIQKFVEELRKHVTIPIHFVDERLTSVEAERMMVEMGIKREQRRQRVDEIAASIILRDFLETQRNAAFRARLEDDRDD